VALRLSLSRRQEQRGTTTELTHIFSRGVWTSRRRWGRRTGAGLFPVGRSCGLLVATHYAIACATYESPSRFRMIWCRAMPRHPAARVIRHPRGPAASSVRCLFCGALWRILRGGPAARGWVTNRLSSGCGLGCGEGSDDRARGQLSIHLPSRIVGPPTRRLIFLTKARWQHPPHTVN